MNKIYVIGGSNVDIYAKTLNNIILRDSNPSTISFSFGGVAHNIVENLLNYDVKSIFITSFGNDFFGKELKNNLEQKGVDLSYANTSTRYGSSTYLAVLDQDDMYLGTVDMSCLKEINANYLNVLKDVIDEKDIVIFDTNLEIETIEYIANNLKGYKAVDAISANKVVKLKTVLDKLDLLKVNKLEAETLANKTLNSDEEILEFISALNLKVKEIIVTSKDKLYIRNRSEVNVYKHYAYNEKPANVTGAGDCLIASYLYGIISDYDLDTRIKFAMTSSIINVEYNEAVAKITKEDVFERMKKIRIEKL